MKVWLVSLGFSLLYLALAVDASDGNVEQVAGNWYILAKSTNCKCLLKHKDHMQVLRVSLAVETPESVTMETTFPMGKECKKIKSTFTKNADGTWGHECHWGKKTVEKVLGSPDDTMIVKATHEKNGDKCDVWILLSPEPEGKQDAIKAFVASASENGFNENEIIVLPPQTACIDSE